MASETDTKQPQNVTPATGGGWVNAALCVAAGLSGSAAAVAAGVSLRTIRRWSKRKSFQDAVEAIRAEMISGTLGRLLSSNVAAIDALTGLLADPQGSIRLGAAGRLLELTLRVRKQLDTERELEQIKADWKSFQSEHPSLFQKEAPTRDRPSND